MKTLRYSIIHPSPLTLLAGLPGPPRGACALPVDAPAAPAAVGRSALPGPELALAALPPLGAVAPAAGVHAVPAAQDRTHA